MVREFKFNINLTLVRPFESTHAQNSGLPLYNKLIIKTLTPQNSIKKWKIQTGLKTV